MNPIDISNTAIDIERQYHNIIEPVVCCLYTLLLFKRYFDNVLSQFLPTYDGLKINVLYVMAYMVHKVPIT